MTHFNFKRHKLALATGLLLGTFGLSVALMQPSVALENAPNVVTAGTLPELTQMIKRTSPAVVNISVEGKSQNNSGLSDSDLERLPPSFRDFFRNLPQQPNSRQESAFGSGFIISSDGYIVTNAHVVNDGEQITVSLNDKQEFTAELIGSDKLSDIALLKVDAKNLPVVDLGNSDELNVGQWVVAIGAPFGLDYTATQGIVSALSRSLPSETYIPFIQTDAAVNPGNSGGPLFDLQGKVIGVNSQIYSRSGGYMGVSFAIPINVVKNVTEQLKSSGQVSRGWLGVGIQDVSHKLAQSFQMKQPNGALVASVQPNSPADKAGIQIGDVITHYDKSPVNSSNDLPLLVGNTPVGNQVSITIWRAGEEKNVNAQINKLASDSSDSDSISLSKTDSGTLGVKVENLSAEERSRNKTGNRGVIIRQVLAGTPAAEAGLMTSDIILMANNIPVDSANSLKDIVSKQPPNKPMAVLFMRNGSNRFVAITLEK